MWFHCCARLWDSGICPFERVCVSNNTHRRVFAGRHLEVGQYVAQFCLHVYHSEPHFCENIQQTGYEVCSLVSAKSMPYYIAA